MTLVPASRLLAFVFVAVLVAAAAGPLPEVRPLWHLLLAFTALAAVADLALTLSRADLPEVTAAPVVRLTRERPGTIELTFARAADGPARTLRVGLGLPATFDSEDEEMLVVLPAGATRSRIGWKCTPRRRGRFPGTLVALETGSRLGFWSIRTRTDLAGEIRVYPNLFTERKQLAALFLAGRQGGARVQRTVGRGREFEKLRDYQPGDGYDEIHWKATAKRGRPVTKVFQAERTQEIYVVLDASRLSARPVVHEGVTQTALERSLTAALVLMLAAERQGDRFGLVAYDSRMRLFLRAGHGRSHYAAVREAVVTLQPGDQTPDVPEIVRHLHTNLRRRALLFFITDLTDPVLAEDFTKHVRVLSRRHLVLVSQLRATEVAPLFAGPEVPGEAEVYRRLAGHARWAEARAVAQRLKPLGVTATLIENETMATQLVTQYLQVKRRQAL